jgi:TldD protein
MTAPDPRRFLYRTLDPDTARNLAAKHLSPHDDGELFLQYAASEAFGFDDGRLKTADYHTASGFGLRGVSGETTAFAHANEISEAAIERAASTLKLLDPRKADAAPPPHWCRSPKKSRCARRSTPRRAPATLACRRSASRSRRAGA